MDHTGLCSNNFTEKNCRLQQDSNLDCRIAGKHTPGPLDHQRGSLKIYFISENKWRILGTKQI